MTSAWRLRTREANAGRSASAAGTRWESTASRAVRNSLAANPGPRTAGRRCPHANSTVDGSPARARATCATIKAVHVAPSGIPVRLPNERSAVGRTRPVACSAGTRPAISAASTLRQATKRAARHEKPKFTQNGSEPSSCGMRLMISPIWVRIGRVRMSAMAPAAEESTSTSTHNCATMRPRLAPSA